MSVYKVSVWIIMSEIEAFAVLKTKKFSIVNDCFQDKNNEEIGHYGQTLISAFFNSRNYVAWSGFAFETLCLKHIIQIKKDLAYEKIYP